MVVQVFIDALCCVDGYVGNARDEAEGRSGARAIVLGAEFGGGDDVAGFGDGVDLGDDDRGTDVEGEADGGVVVAGNARSGDNQILC